MINKPKLLTILLATAFLGGGISLPAFAQDSHGAHHEAEQASELAGEQTNTDPRADFVMALGEAETAAAANDLASMHKYSERMAKALEALQGTDAAKDTLVANTITQAIPVAKSLDTTGDSGDMPGTLAVLKKLQGTEAVFKARLGEADMKNMNMQDRMDNMGHETDADESSETPEDHH